MSNLLSYQPEYRNPLSRVVSCKQIPAVDLVIKLQIVHGHEVGDIRIRRVIEKQQDLPRIFAVYYAVTVHRFLFHGQKKLRPYGRSGILVAHSFVLGQDGFELSGNSIAQIAGIVKG